jgi:predicted alpha/beta superfamily hydrolase
VAQVQTYYEVFKNMASYVDSNYTNNTSRTFIGRGSEGGVVILTLLLESSETTVFNNFIATDPASAFKNNAKFIIDNEDFPPNMENMKLHLSFSSDSDIATCNALIQSIEDAQYPWLEFESVEYPDDIFEDMYPVAFAAGLKFVFDN